MKHILSRRALGRATAGGLCAPLIGRYARDAEIVWRIGHVAPENAALHQRLLEAGEAIAKRSDGKMELTVIGAAKAGIQSGLLVQARNGGIEMAVAQCTTLAPLMPVYSVPSIGFLFGDYPSVWSAMDGALGQSIRAQASAPLGLEILEKAWDLGFREFTSSVRPIRTAADVSGLKIRTQIDEDQMDLLRSLDIVPIVTALQNLRSALERRELDGQEGLLTVVDYARLSEVQKYCAMTRHGWDGLMLCINAEAWKKLPERLQRIVANTFNGAAAKQREDVAKQEDSLRVTMTSTGMTFNEVDKASFRDMLRRKGYYARQKTKLGSQTWTLIENASGISA